jgi:hypothetical protein
MTINLDQYMDKTDLKNVHYLFYAFEEVFFLNKDSIIEQDKIKLLKLTEKMY